MQESLQESNRQLDVEVKAELAERIAETEELDLPAYSSYPIMGFQAEALEIVGSCGYDTSDLKIGPPPPRVKEAEDVDLAINIAGLAKRAGKKIPDVSNEIAKEISRHKFVSEVRVAGPFINIVLNEKQMAPLILANVSEQGDKYGHFNEGDSKVAVVDYSGPNTAKNLTIAHLRSTIIGHAMKKVLTAAGFTAFGINHLGDWGTQCGKVMYQYTKEFKARGEEFLSELEKDPMMTLMNLYRSFVGTEDSDPEALEEAKQIFLKLEHGDPELFKLWDQIRKWSLEALQQVYDRLGIKFDAIQGESFYEDRMQPTMEEALDANVLKKNGEGAIVFPGQELKDATTGKVNGNMMKTRSQEEGAEREMVWKDEIVVKPSGGTVYLTRDICGLKYRVQELDAARVLYVIGKEQDAHCSMLFNMADQLGYAELGSAEHLSIGHLNVSGRKMSSRGGGVELLNEVLDDSITAAEELILRRKKESDDDSPLTDEEKETARRVGIGTLIFNDLKQDRAKDIEYSPDAAGRMEAGGCPYIQYTYCRLKSILRKAGESGDCTTIPEDITADEKKLILQLGFLPQAISDAVRTNSAHKLSTYIDQLTRSINGWYHSHDVIKAEDPKTKAFRLALVEACQQVLKNAVDLLHIELPERM